MTELFRDASGPRQAPRASVCAIGAFDGVHLGHQHLLATVRARADALAAEAVAISFEPLPREFFQRGLRIARLSSARQKFELLRAAGIDRVGLLRFDQALSETPAEAFVERLLVGALHAREVWIGPEFRFGHGRRGDLALLRQMGEQFGFSAQVLSGVTEAEERISSTRIRAALAAADHDTARRMLGREFSIGGRVVHGLKLGRTLGYPTANLPMLRRLPPVFGVYAVRVSGAGLVDWPGVASLGTRPTIEGRELLLEAHLFDFEGDLYGQRLEVAFIGKLRDEVRFANLDDLVVRMHQDAREAREILQWLKF
ncbi:MAG: bifunctional riboflavin kinase/FAD synthetase [Lysobacterales bacterium]